MACFAYRYPAAQVYSGTMNNAKVYSATSPTSPLASASIGRRDPVETDVQIEILFCGVCHSDLHQSRNEWSNVAPTVYPCVPGHEIVGRVTKTGSAVTKFKVGDLAAVGCMVDSCGVCPECKESLEQFCHKFPTFTYNAPDKHTGGVTYGGYSESIVVDQRFVLKGARQSGSGRNRSSLVRRDHHLLAIASLGCHQRKESRRGWARRFGPHGCEVRARLWRSRGSLYYLAKQKRRCAAIGR